MKLNVFQKISGFLLVGLLGSAVQAQTPDIPTNVSGTYTLTYAYASSSTPFANGTVKTFVLNGATDTVCVDGVSLGTGFYRAGVGSEMFWDGGNGVYYSLSLLDAGGLSEFNVYSPNIDSWHGQFPGPGTFSSAVTCGGTVTPTLSTSQQAAIDLAAGLYPDLFTGAGTVKTAQGYTYLTFASGVSVGFKDGSLYLAGGPFGAAIQNKGTLSAVTTSLTNLKNSVAVTATTDMTNLFAQAALAYPTLFAGGGSLQTSADGYLYKYYATTGLYAAIKNGSVYVKGGSYGNAYTSVGALNSVLTALNVKINGGSNGIPQGNFNLTVSGTVSIAGPVSISQPFSYTITGIPAPDVSDQQDIRDAFVASLNSSGVTINSFSYTVVENAANRVEFSVSVSATTAGIGYTYVLNYVYSK